MCSAVGVGCSGGGACGGKVTRGIRKGVRGRGVKTSDSMTNLWLPKSDGFYKISSYAGLESLGKLR